MSNNVVICPNCQQAVSLPPGVTGGFCPYCNALLNVPQKKGSAAIMIIAIVGSGILLLVGVGVLLYSIFGKNMDNIRRSFTDNSKYRASCMNNLKQIGNALEMYCQGSTGQLRPHGQTKDGAVIPTMEGAENAMEVLRRQGFLPDHKVYVCPSSDAKAGEGYDALSYREKNLSYGYVYVSARYSSASAVSSDLAEGWGGAAANKANHKDYGNILYADGHVAGKIGSSDPDEKETWYSKDNLGIRTSYGIGIPPNKVPTR